MLNNNQHWTHSLADFAYWVTSDFTMQIQVRLGDTGVSKNELAQRINVSLSRVSQVLNDPGNLTLGNTVKYARALGMKVALVAYDDGDPGNIRGPINAEIFTRCWERLGSPRDVFEFNKTRCWLVHEYKKGDDAEADTAHQKNIQKITLESQASTGDGRIYA